MNKPLSHVDVLAGSNLNEVLEPFGISVAADTVLATSAAESLHPMMAVLRADAILDKRLLAALQSNSTQINTVRESATTQPTISDSTIC